MGAGLLIPRTIRRRLNPRQRSRRWAIKAAIIALATLLAFYPDPRLLVRNVIHWSSLDRLINPNAAGLDELDAELDRRLPPDADAYETLEAVQHLVNERIAYAWDWDVWGAVDYLPTVEETLEAGREDCDGRAIVAASLLVRRGHEARLVSDFQHVWVWTPDGETMSPRQTASGETVVEADESGVRVNAGAAFHPGGIFIDHPAALAYGVAVFPAWRQLLLIIAAWGALHTALPRPRRETVALALLLAGWFSLRHAGQLNAGAAAAIFAWSGILGAAVAALLMILPLRVDRPRPNAQN